MLEALIPVFISYLYFPTNVTSPISEFLVEKSCQNPMSVSEFKLDLINQFGLKLFWAIKSLPWITQERVVFAFLIDSILCLSPSIRKHAYKETKLVKYIYDYMALYSKPEDMLENFQIPPETFPAYIPTNPSLPIKDLKITDAKNIGDTRKVNKYQVVHNNPRHSIEFQISVTSETNYNYKALSLIKILNQMMIEGGCDYGVILPDLVQTSSEMEILQPSKEAVKISMLTESHKEFQDFIKDPNYTLEEKMYNFQQSVTAFCIFTYLFGGINHDSGKCEIC